MFFFTGLRLFVGVNEKPQSFNEKKRIVLRREDSGWRECQNEILGFVGIPRHSNLPCFFQNCVISAEAELSQQQKLYSGYQEKQEI
ncbi:hypothetical protein R1T41_00670 (plasmid) [Thalassospira lucentensis]|nr:hypothetical protein R1T41_00670 [Thalassospira lucentensis]